MSNPVRAGQLKYSKDGPFADPVVRCDSCQALIKTESLKELGMCQCGNRRVRNVQTFNEVELEQMKEWKIDPDFIALFEARDV